MKNKVKVDSRYCPSCGFEVQQKLIEFSRFNYECPRCDTYRLSDFVIGFTSENVLTVIENKEAS